MRLRWLTVGAEAGEVQTALTEDERRDVARKARAASLEALKALGGEARREEVRRHALEHGGFTPRERAATAPPKAQHKHADAVEHALAWALTDLKRAGLVDNPRWSVWRVVGATGSEAAAEQRISASRLRELRAMSHPAFLSTSEWRTTRAAMLKRAGNRCQLDATHVGPLDVHHNTYERKGVELAGDLVVLCSACHHRYHTEPEPQTEPEPARPVTQPFVVPLDWTSPKPTPKPSFFKRLLAR